MLSTAQSTNNRAASRIAGNTKQQRAKNVNSGLKKLHEEDGSSHFLFAKLPEPEVSISSEVDIDVLNMQRLESAELQSPKTKLILNDYIDDFFSEGMVDDLDDEIITVDESAPLVDYRQSFSANDELAGVKNTAN